MGYAVPGKEGHFRLGGQGDSLSHSWEPGVLFQLSSQCPKCCAKQKQK